MVAIHKHTEARRREEALGAFVEAELCKTAEQLGVWDLVDLSYELGGPCDPVVVKALREADPTVAPLWLTRVWKVPGHQEHVVDHRHVIARLIDQPRVAAMRASALPDVRVPRPLPPELAGLPAGPYIECELLEDESPDGGKSPGRFQPLDWRAVEILRRAVYALRNHSLEELVQIRRLRLAKESATKRAQRREFLRSLERPRHVVQAERGELVTTGGCYGDHAVSVSAQLMRMRKIAAGDQS